MKHICPVCGYSNLAVIPYDNIGTPSDEICPSCYFHYGYDDYACGVSFEQWRQEWVSNGMKWSAAEQSPPAGWDPKQQLLNIGVKL